MPTAANGKDSKCELLEVESCYGKDKQKGVVESPESHKACYYTRSGKVNQNVYFRLSAYRASRRSVSINPVVDRNHIRDVGPRSRVHVDHIAWKKDPKSLLFHICQQTL